MPQVSWKDAIVAVLFKAGEAMHYKSIAEEVVSQGIRRDVGATPANTIYATISLSIKNDGDESPFIKTNPGVFMLKETASSQTSGAEHMVPSDVPDRKQVVKCVGMFWNASKIIWRTKPRLLGQQQQGAKVIDFGEQIGIYLLHDRSRVIYVGRSVDRPLGQRLAEHTKDRLNGRWDRFSWFGLRGVENSGKLTEPDFTSSLGEIISLMEAILIEALEPPQNRKRGDDFSEIEYLQVADSEKQDQKKKALLEMLQTEMNDGD